MGGKDLGLSRRVLYSVLTKFSRQKIVGPLCEAHDAADAPAAAALLLQRDERRVLCCELAQGGLDLWPRDWEARLRMAGGEERRARPSRLPAPLSSAPSSSR